MRKTVIHRHHFNLSVLERTKTTINNHPSGYDNRKLHPPEVLIIGIRIVVDVFLVCRLALVSVHH